MKRLVMSNSGQLAAAPTDAYVLTQADINGANAGQRPDLIVDRETIYEREGDGVLFQSNGLLLAPCDPVAAGGLTSYTWATKPAAGAVAAGTLIRVTGSVLRGLWESDGTYWRYFKAVSLLANGNPGTTTVGTTETVLAAIPLPAGCLADVGKVVVEALFSFPNNANTKEIQMRVGGTGITGTSLSLNNFTTTQKQAIRMGFMNRNIATSQVQTSLEYTSGYGGTTPAVLTAAVDTSVDQTVYITGRCVVGTDTITLQALDANLV